MRFFLAAALICFALSPVQAQQPDPLRVCMAEGNSPLSHRVAKEPRGLDLAVAQAIASEVRRPLQVVFFESLASRARNKLIANSAPLIAEIESHRARKGAYPVSIFALYGDVKPVIVGVERYYYEPSGDAYNLIFEEPSPAFGLRRFVVYNPRDKQRLTVHETDRLRLDDAGLDADNAGYTIVEPLPQAHWKLFTFRS